MEPEYRGLNGRIDALAAAWLFANDQLFFMDGDIAWDGTHHSINGLQSNIALQSEAPDFWSDRLTLAKGAADLVLYIEQDEDLIVPRSQISPGLHKAIRDGDLTGLTLFNLQACARAFQFLDGSNFTAYGSLLGGKPQAEDESNREIVQKVLQTAGMDHLLENPAAMSMTRVVMFDTRLAKGIPNFFGLVTKMYQDMLAYNEIDLPYILVFVATRNVDADQCLGEVDKPVPGAGSEPVHVETNVQEWQEAQEPKGSEESSEVSMADSGEQAAGEAADEEDEGSERDAIIAMLNLLVLGQELNGKSYISQDLIDELARAEDGDESIDLMDLAKRMNDAVPSSESADLSSVTFDDGNIANGRRFKIAYPDGWTAVEDYEESALFMTQARPFVIVQGEATAEDDLSLRDRIIYSSLDGDHEIDEVDEKYGFDDKYWALRWWSSYDRSDDEGIASMKPTVVWDTEVEAVNTKCFVSQQEINDGPNGLEFDVYPYAADHLDSLRFVFTYEDGMDVEAVKSLVLKMAKSIELDKPHEPKCMKTLKKALSEKVPVDDFIEMASDIFNPYAALRQNIFTAAQYKYAQAADQFNETECTLAGARGIACLANRAIPKFEKMLDAYDVQVASGYTIGELERVLDALEVFSRVAFPTTEIFDCNDAKLVEDEGIFDAPEELQTVLARLNYAKEHGGMPSKPSGAKLSGSTVVAFASVAQAKTRERKVISESFTTDAIPRLEKALNERVSSPYFIETSEIAANALMVARQEACDEETSSWNSDEDNVIGMARAFCKFNSIICRYYGYFVDALEAQVELGATPGDIKKMAAEVNEFGELVADRFSCGNEYLDEVANEQSPVVRPAEYQIIRSRWQKINSR